MRNMRSWLGVFAVLSLTLIGRGGIAAADGIESGTMAPNAEFYVATFTKHGVFSKIRLGAAYLLRPEVAISTNVVWGYLLSSEEIQDTMTDSLVETCLYFKATDRKEYAVLSEPASLLAIAKAGSVRTLLDQGKAADVEIGIVLSQPTWSDLKYDTALVSWGSNNNTFSLKDEAMTRHIISNLIRSGSLKTME